MSPQPNRTGEGKRLLLVEDGDAQREALSAILSEAGYEVQAVGSPEEAVAAMRSAPRDILLSDLNLGEPADGLLLATAMRNLHPKSAVVLLTGYPDLDFAMAHIRRQVDGFLLKPFEPAAIAGKLEDVLKNRRQSFGQRGSQHVSGLIRNSKAYILENWLKLSEADPQLSAIQLSRQERLNHLPEVLDEVASRLERQSLSMSDKAVHSSTKHGETRHRQRYSIPLMLLEGRLLHKVIAGVVQENLLVLDMSTVIEDMVRIGNALAEQLDVSVREYQRIELLPSTLQKEKLAATGRMAATIAHEINNPLEAITNLLYLASLDDRLSEASRDYIAQAEEQIKRITHITQQTLGFHRSTTASVSFQMSEVLDEVLNTYLAKLQAKNIRVVREYKTSPDVQGHPGEIRQVFGNLIVNAIDASDEGGTLRLRVEPSKRDNGVCANVEDRGRGISPENLSRVFEPFFTTKRNHGTGLGLWVVKEILQKHEGRIHVESSTEIDKRGTCFTVFLPARKGVLAGLSLAS